MVNQAAESQLAPEQRHTLEGLRAQLKVTSIRIARLNRELVAAERELLAEYTEARRLSYLIRHHERGAET